MSTIQAQIIVRESLSKKQLSSKEHNNLDDYFRLISSGSGKLLASISNTKQLLLYDIESQSLISNFQQDNVTYCSFNEDETLLAITTRKPSIKVYEITQTKDTTQNKTIKQVNKVKQIRPTVLSHVYGWIVSTIDNSYFIYTQNDQIFALNSQTYQQQLISIDPQIKTKCAPYYLVIDREMKHLVSSSRIGQICKFNITFKDNTQLAQQVNIQQKQQSNIRYWPQITLLQSTTLSSSSFLTSYSLTSSSLMTISDMNQSRGFILISTSKVIQQSQPYYNTFVISKSNINIISKIRLQQQLIAPPLTIMSDNVQNYLLTFLKGQKILYIYDLAQLQRQNKLVDYELIQSDDSQFTDIKRLNYISKQQMPFLMHAINYNIVTKNLMMGISSVRNEDKIIYVDFYFNCSSLILKYQQQSNVSLAVISNTSLLLTNQTTQMIKPACVEECKEIDNKSVYLFSRRQCVVKSGNELAEENKCKQLAPNYKWNTQGDYCQLQCLNVPNSLSYVSYSQPPQCYCNKDYAWDTISSKCVNSVVIQHNKTNQTVIDTNNTNDNNDIIPQQQSQRSNIGVGIGVSFGVVAFIIGLLVFLYFYKTKKLCFKNTSSTSYIEQNQLKQTQSAKQSNSDDNKSNNDNKSQQIHVQVQPNQQKPQIEVDNDQINVDSQRNF